MGVALRPFSYGQDQSLWDGAAQASPDKRAGQPAAFARPCLIG